MNKWLVLMLAIVGFTVQAETLVEGKHYKIINPAGKTSEPTVVEVFSYGCPACFKIESAMEAWLKTKPAQIKFIRIPHFGIHDDGGWFIKTFYTAEALGIGEQIHLPLFKMVQVDRKHFKNEDDVVSYLAKFGKDAKLIKETMNGFYVDNKVRVAQNYVKTRRTNSTPNFVVNDKYFTDGQMAGNVEVLQQILTELALKK